MCVFFQRKLLLARVFPPRACGRGRLLSLPSFLPAPEQARLLPALGRSCRSPSPRQNAPSRSLRRLRPGIRQISTQMCLLGRHGRTEGTPPKVPPGTLHSLGLFPLSRLLAPSGRTPRSSLAPSVPSTSSQGLELGARHEARPTVLQRGMVTWSRPFRPGFTPCL